MAYQITVHPQRFTFEAESGETLLDAALRQGVVVPYGCRNGACGACRGQILQGEVDPGSYQPFALSASEVESGAALLCCAKAQSDLTIEHPGMVDAIPPKIVPAKVERMTLRAPDVMEVILRLPPGEAFPFYAGQFVDLLLVDGQRRSYSVANAPEQKGLLELHIRRVPGGRFTGHVFSAMKAGDILRLEGPRGSFFLRESDSPAILLAGGTGFAPIKAIIEQAAARGQTRSLHLYWGCRSTQDLYHDLPRQWAETHDWFRYTPVLSEPDSGWSGRTGLAHQAVLQDFDDLSGHQVYACGNPAMIDVARTDFIERGLKKKNFFADPFTFQTASL